MTPPRGATRYVPFTVRQAPSLRPHTPPCVYGEETDCGAVSGEHLDPAPVEERMRKHTQQIRHARFRRTFTDYALWEPANGPCEVAS